MKREFAHNTKTDKLLRILHECKKITYKNLVNRLTGVYACQHTIYESLLNLERRNYITIVGEVKANGRHISEIEITEKGKSVLENFFPKELEPELPAEKMPCNVWMRVCYMERCYLRNKCLAYEKQHAVHQ